MPSNLSTPSSSAEIMCHQGGDCLEKSYQSARQRFHIAWRRLSASPPSTFPSHPKRSDSNSDSDTDASVDVYKRLGAAHVAHGNPSELPIYPRIGGMIAMGQQQQQRWLRVVALASTARGACFVAAQLVSLAGGQGSNCSDRVWAVNKSYQLAETVLSTLLNTI